VFPPPPVNGLGQVGGFKLELEDRAGLGESALNDATQALIGKAYQTPELAGVFTGYRVNVPQLEVEVDREKVKQEGISLTDLFQTMQVYLGSVYANDFNRFGRTYQVKVQADAQYRATAENITQLKVRNDSGQMVPLGSVLQVKPSHGPDQGLRYNGYPAADINGGPAPATARARRKPPSSGSRARCCRTASGTNGPTSATSSGSRATRRSSSFRCASCSRSWCWRRSTRAGRYRSR